MKQGAIFGVCEKELCGSRDMRPFSCRFAIYRERPSHQTEPSKTSLAQPYQLVWNIFSKHPKNLKSLLVYLVVVEGGIPCYKTVILYVIDIKSEIIGQ